MGKTSTSTQTNTVDPQLARESHSLLNLFRLLAGGGHQVNRGVTTAGFTPKQQEAFSMGDAAASAFGFNPSGRDPMPETETSAMGIEGYRPSREYDFSMAALPEGFRNLMSKFYDQASQQTKYKQMKSAGGGKK